MNKSFSSYANLSLADLYKRKNDYGKTIEYLKKIPDSSFAAATKYEYMGDTLSSIGKFEEAISAYNKSLEINSGQKFVLKKLALLYLKTDKRKAHEVYRKYKYIDSFYTVW